MADIEFVIKISEEIYKNIQNKSTEIQAEGYTVENAILNGMPLPEHHGRLIDEDEIVKFYKSNFPSLDNGCHWSRMDIIHNLADIPTILKASDPKESEDSIYKKMEEIDLGEIGLTAEMIGVEKDSE